MPTVVDLFSGCGGLSLGAHRAGFSTAIAIDADPILSGSFCSNFPDARLLNTDICAVDANLLRNLLPHDVDGVIGGPPCQAFSTMGHRDINDPRRRLVLEYFRVIKLIKPKFFLFENVCGLGSDENISILRKGIASLGEGWRIVGPVVLNAADFGAPTKRRRLFVFGFDPQKMDIPTQTELCLKSEKIVSVRDAIWDLDGATNHGFNENGFDLWSYDGRKKVSDYAKLMRSRSGHFTGHQKTEHNKSTLKRFQKLMPGSIDKIGKYKRLAWEGFCPTLRAGTGNDRGSYQAVRPIHPVANRVITPREAARLQGFPDDFIFHPTVWHSCRMIGNSVSPIIASALLDRIAKHLPMSSKRRLPLAA